MKGVTVIFKSGRTANFTVEQFKTFTNGFGALSKIEWEGVKDRIPMYMGLSNVDAILAESVNEKPSVKQDDHPIEDVFGEEVQTDDIYYKFGQDIVLEHNLKTYLIEQQQVECFQAQ